MDLESAKENIQPLAGGRNASLLQFALNAEKRQKEHDELLSRRREYEESIKNYTGDDPLALWYEFISWIQQAFPRSGKESEFQEALQKCLQIFEHADQYKQDVRMIKLYIKFIDSQSQANRHEFYSFLFNQGIGTMVADLYLGWAYYFEAMGNFPKAQEIYQMGLAARAEPIDELRHSLTQLQIIAVEGARCTDEEEYNSKFLAHMTERRFALTSLQGQSKKKNLVGSLRTGDAVVKSRTPGVVPVGALQENVQNACNVPVTVCQDGEFEIPSDQIPSSSSQIKSVVESAIKANLENIREPGPWSSCSGSSGGSVAKKKGSLFSKKEIANNPGFEICEDSMEEQTLTVEDEDRPAGIQLPTDFVRHNEPQPEWNVPLTIAEESTAIPAYVKRFVYPPGLDREFSLEEARAYRWWNNRFVRPQTVRVLEEMASFMEGVNLPENFATFNAPQSNFEPESQPFDGGPQLLAMCRVLSRAEAPESSYEELLREKYLKKRAASKQAMELRNAAMDMELEEEMEMTEINAVIPVATNKEQEVVVEVEPEQEPEQEDENDERRNSNSPFGFNETCSTQIFNLFIKPQSISTPNLGKKSKSVLPRCSLAIYKDKQQGNLDNSLVLEKQKPPQQMAAENKSPPTMTTTMIDQLPPPQMSSTMIGQVPNTSPPDPHQQLLGKHLSVIMETTENSASSGGCQTTTTTNGSTDATITKNSVVHGGDHTTITSVEMGLRGLADKPRKSILKRPECSVIDSVEEVEDSLVSAAVAEPFQVYVDEFATEKTAAKLDSFLIPPTPQPQSKTNSHQNVPIYRDSMDLFGASSSQALKSDFAIPLPPKPKTFMPLYNDSMEHFLEKAKTVPKIPIVDQQQQEIDQLDEDERVINELLAGNAVGEQVSIYKMPEREDFERSKLAAGPSADFSIFHDSLMAVGGKEKSMMMGAIPKSKAPANFGVDDKENNSKLLSMTGTDGTFSPLSSFLLSGTSSQPQQQPRQQQRNPLDHSMSFFDTPKKIIGGGGRSSAEMTMPTIAAIDPLLLEHSMTFPSMRELATTTMMQQSGRINNNKSMAGKQQQQLQQHSIVAPVALHPDLLDDSMTFNSLMKKETNNKSVNRGGGDCPSFKPNESIFSLQRELATGSPPVPQLNESMTFNSLMRKEGEKGKGASPSNSIVVGLQEMNLHEPTATLNLPKPTLLNDSITFNSLMKKEQQEGDLFVRPTNPNQSTFPNLMMELPSSTAHGFSVFAKKTADGNGNGGHAVLHMDKPISPIPSVRIDDEDEEVLMEEEEDQDVDIYKFENTLRVLPEVAEQDLHSWYDDHLEKEKSSREGELDKGEEKLQRKKQKMAGVKNYLDPFDPDLINDLLTQVEIVSYLETNNECEMREKIAPLKQGGQVEICDHVFSVRKLIGKGAFGQIYSAKTVEGRLVALKQSRPCNLWEYYICMEVKWRLNEFNEDLLSAFIDIEHVLVAKNASIFVVPFCPYGNLINVANEVKRETGRNLSEKVVMVLVAQILTVIDALHACQIIHADIKPDNIMLMAPIDVANLDRPVVKLIDFGQAIDMKLFPTNVEFHSALATDGFTCSEMLENRPWTYQTDLYCLAGTIHTLLMGKYMNVQKGICGYAVKFPRYLQKIIWDEIFDHLLNVIDCRTMPNLQQMKLLLKQYISDNEVATQEEVRRFNQIVLRVQVLDK